MSLLCWHVRCVVKAWRRLAQCSIVDCVGRTCRDKSSESPQWWRRAVGGEPGQKSSRPDGRARPCDWSDRGVRSRLFQSRIDLLWRSERAVSLGNRDKRGVSESVSVTKEVYQRADGSDVGRSGDECEAGCEVSAIRAKERKKERKYIARVQRVVLGGRQETSRAGWCARKKTRPSG